MSIQMHETKRVARDPAMVFALTCAAIGLPVLFLIGLVGVYTSENVHGSAGLMLLATIGAAAVIGGIIGYHQRD